MAVKAVVTTGLLRTEKTAFVALNKSPIAEVAPTKAPAAATPANWNPAPTCLTLSPARVAVLETLVNAVLVTVSDLESRVDSSLRLATATCVPLIVPVASSLA